MNWGRKWLTDFIAGKTQLVLFGRFNNTSGIAVKMDGPVLEERSSIKMLGLTFSSKLDWGSYIISIAKTSSKKIGALIRSMKFLSSEFLCVSINLPYGHVWNTVLCLPSATWNCWISHKNVYAGLLLLPLLPLLNP